MPALKHPLLLDISQIVTSAHLTLQELAYADEESNADASGMQAVLNSFYNDVDEDLAAFPARMARPEQKAKLVAGIKTLSAACQKQLSQADRHALSEDEKAELQRVVNMLAEAEKIVGRLHPTKP